MGAQDDTGGRVHEAVREQAPVQERAAPAARPVRVQAKMAVGAHDDAYEVEADRVAAEVVARLSGSPVLTGAPHVARRADPAMSVGPEGGELDAATESRINSMRGGGSPLAPAVRAPLESAMGADFGAVRIHEGSEATKISRSIGASAFTVGSDVFFQGRVPSGNEGTHLLAHELTHTLQQGGAAHRSMSAHDHGCNCSSCPTVRRSFDAATVQRSFFDDVMVFFHIKTREEVRQEGLALIDKAKWETTILDNSLMKTVAGKIGVKDFVEASLAVAAPLKSLLELAIKYWSSFKLGDLQPAIAVATGEQKKAVWSDDALMTKAEGALGKDAYLTFLTQIGMHQQNTTVELGEGGAEHTAPAKADEIIRDKMSAYVANAVKAGKKVEGQIGIVGGSDWDRAGVAHYGEQTWFRASPTPKRDAINGFVDSAGRIWVERNSGNPGTVIHEGLHKYSSDAVLTTLGFNVNEGMTEYFTRLICADLGITRTNYNNNHELITALAGKVTKDVIASSYFDGGLEGLKTAFVKYRTETKKDSPELAAQIWNALVAKLKAGQWAKALQCVNDDLTGDTVAAL